MRIIADTASAAGSWATVGLLGMALFGAALALHRWMKRNVAEPIKQVAVIAEAQRSTDAVIRRIDGRLLTVEAQVTNNGGASMKDSTDRNEQMTAATAKGVEKLLKRGDG